MAAEAALQRLLDENAIRAVLCRYARALDRQDWELLRTCYHADGIDDHGAFHGDVEALVEWLKAENGAYLGTTHFLGNVLIHVAGDSAAAETYCIAIHRQAGTAKHPARDIINRVRYCDRLERRRGEWRIAHRVVARDPAEIRPVAAEPPPHARDAIGRRDGSDPSYELPGF